MPNQKPCHRFYAVARFFYVAAVLTAAIPQMEKINHRFYWLLNISKSRKILNSTFQLFSEFENLKSTEDSYICRKTFVEKLKRNDFLESAGLEEIALSLIL
jgi:hypothetical protein